MEREIGGSGCFVGYRRLWTRLRRKGCFVKRSRIMTLLKDIDPEGVDSRKKEETTPENLPCERAKFRLAHRRLR